MTKDLNKEKIMKNENLILKIVMIAMLGIAIITIHAYGYYVLLKLVVCGGCGYLASIAYSKDARGWLWVFGGIAVAYNPIIRFPLGREVWTFVNIATIVALVGSMKGRK